MADFDLKTDTNVGASPQKRSNDGTHPADVARGAGPTDPFPPEGTDEKIIAPLNEAEQPISEDETLKATQAALDYDAPRSKDQPEEEGRGFTLIEVLTTAIDSFLMGLLHTTPRRTHLRADKKMRNDMNEDQIDSMIDDSFPASDPPSSY